MGTREEKLLKRKWKRDRGAAKVLTTLNKIVRVLDRILTDEKRSLEEHEKFCEVAKKVILYEVPRMRRDSRSKRSSIRSTGEYEEKENFCDKSV